MAFLWAAVLLLGIISSTEGSVSYWGPWSPWSTCSMTCGRGTQTRTRVCLKYQTCEGPATETRYCDYPPCQPKCIPPPPSKWGPWSRWSPCSVSCGGGSRTRKRLCLKYDCIGPNTETGPCNYQKCPPTICPDDERSQEQEWELTTVEIFTNSTDIMIGTVDCKGQKLGLCWRFEDMTFDQSVTIVSPPCNRLRAGTAESGSPVGQYLGDDCTYEVPVGDDVQVNVMDALGGVCDITQYPVAPDCPNSQVVEIDFFSQKTDIGVLLNVIPEDDEISVLVGLLGNDTTLAGTGFMRYNATIKAIPGTPWKGVRYIDNDRRVLINGQCTYFTTSQRKQTVFVGPVCGGFGDWGPWEDCMLTVKGWRQLRRRPCDNPPPQNDGECEGNQFQYRRCVCAAPVIPPTAVTGPLQTGYNHSDTVEVCCRKGYVSALTGRSSFTICCDFFNRWENFQTCIRQECPNPVFRNGVVKKGKPPYYPGAEVTVVCNHGYTNIYGKRTFKSRCTGTEWFPGRCVRKYCDPLPSITYSLSVTLGMSSYRPGDTVRVTCVVGYTLSPNKTLTCDDNGRWTPSLRCLATTCPNAIDLFRYNIGSARLGEPGTPEYNVAFLTCKFGFTARGQPSYTSTCLPDGTWSNLQQCQQSGGGMKLVMDKTSIGLLVGLLLVVGLSALFCFLLCCKNICCAPKQPVLIPPARPPVHRPPIYQAPPACPKPKQPSSFWRVMYRLRQTPAPTVVSTC